MQENDKNPVAAEASTHAKRNRDEEDAEEEEAWREGRGVMEVLEVAPEMSKEETVRLLTAQYDQALMQVSWAASMRRGMYRAFVPLMADEVGQEYDG